MAGFAGSAYAESSDEITIWHDPNCGCCSAYAAYLEGENFHVTKVADPDFAARSLKVGLTEDTMGCHLAQIDGYYVSGHVPSEIIQRLLKERPDVDGITLPGMPDNSPGMAEVKTGTLKVLAFNDGKTRVYSEE